MIELLLAAGVGAGGTAGLMRFLMRKPAKVVLLDVGDGWDEEPKIYEQHEHDGHIAGTTMRGGVKVKKMYCSLCSKKWTEPCS